MCLKSLILTYVFKCASNIYLFDLLLAGVEKDHLKCIWFLHQYHYYTEEKNKSAEKAIIREHYWLIVYT